MNTLIVDDDEKARMLLGHVMASIGHEVTVCATATEAYELTKSEFYPLILLDWMLPEMDGIEFCKKFRARPDGDSNVIIMITARDKPEDLKAVLDAGADDYIAKTDMNIDLLKVRLKVAEQTVIERIRRKEGEARLAELYAQIEKRHDNMCSILNELRLGAMIIEHDGGVAFLNRNAEILLGVTYDSAGAKHWEKLIPFKNRDEKKRVGKMLGLPPGERKKFTYQIQNSDGKDYWVDFDIKDDPHDPERKIFLFYDVSEIHNLRNRLNEQAQFHGLIGRSEPMLALRQQIEEFAKLDWTVLIEGETGVGKELVAKAIHFSSDRKDKPFITVNTAGLSDSLLSSQLFGHRRGAFTGAVEDQIGLFESANGGTLFLDEIGDISPSVQVSLLRALEERTVVRLGETRERNANVRFVTATNKNLNDEVAKGNFRSDLLYRIRVGRINVPPLRERSEDIPLLTEQCLSRSGAATGKSVNGISDSAMALMMRYGWPGNVRELKSSIDYAVIHSSTSTLELGDLPPEILDSRYGDNREEIQTDFLKMDIDKAIKAAGGNHAKAARRLGISRSTLYRRLAK